MPTTNSAQIDLVMAFPDSRRHPLVADSKDWERIGPALVEWGMLADMGLVNGPAIRVLMEVAYVMGFERGKAEAQNPLLNFVVADEG